MSSATSGFGPQTVTSFNNTQYNIPVRQSTNTNGNTEVFRVSDIITNGSQENKPAGDAVNEELARQEENVTNSDIRSIKLNYLQFNKRTAVTAA